ncbi:MAG: hypothetical protein ACD_62C00002G0011 [uncultured bacterium]|nr:MAG: hypothetical protein ACD_62C00002G0011 [uncultured bacterium]HLD45555.1 hypothetical protein [bacterium]
MFAKEPVQLYTLIHQFSNIVENKDELGSIISYVLVSTLMEFSAQAGSWQEMQVEQIAAIYQGLEDTLDQCRSSDSYQILCALNVKVHEFLKTVETEKDIVANPLLKHIMTKLANKRGVPADTFRRSGLALVNAIIERGALTRKVDCLKQDYRIIEVIFAT